MSSMGFGFGGFDFLFSVFPVIFGITFVVILGFIVVRMVQGVSQWHSNNQQPVLTVAAEVVTKRENVTHSRHNSGPNNEFHHTTTDTSYYATFQVESGDRMEFLVSGQEYGMLAEGDQGKLTFQGTRYHGFERQ